MVNKDEYSKLVKEYTPKENKLKHFFWAFFIGGLVGVFAEFINHCFINCFGMVTEDAASFTCLLVIFLASLFTSLGFFDNWVSFARAGLFIPTTGFAHALSSAALDYRNDGFISGIGSCIFRLAGSVILYGIVGAFLCAIIGVLIYG